VKRVLDKSGSAASDRGRCDRFANRASAINFLEIRLSQKWHVDCEILRASQWARRMRVLSAAIVAHHNMPYICWRPVHRVFHCGTLPGNSPCQKGRIEIVYFRISPKRSERKTNSGRPGIAYSYDFQNGFCTCTVIEIPLSEICNPAALLVRNRHLSFPEPDFAFQCRGPSWIQVSAR